MHARKYGYLLNYRTISYPAIAIKIGIGHESQYFNSIVEFITLI